MQVIEFQRAAAAKALPGGLAGWLLGVWRGRSVAKAARHMRVVETLALGGRKTLSLVMCDGERFLVGGGADSVDSIVRVGQEVACE